MYQFFVENNQINDKTVVITGPDVNHIKNVLRIKPGEEFNVITEEPGLEYRCTIREYADDELICDLLFIKENDTELDANIILFQGLPKADKMELIVQKAVELGVSRIVPVAMDRSVVKLDDKKSSKKVDRWNGISEAAAKQSKRGFIPEVTPVKCFKEIMDEYHSLDLKLLPYEMADMNAMDKTREIIKSVKPGDSIGIFIGPEGGFSEREIDMARECGWNEITLGHRILRTETAGLVVLSWMVMELEK